MEHTYLPTLAPTAASVSPSRLRLLTELQRNRGTGMTVDELSESLSVSHNAVQQHLTALQRDGLVRISATRATGGRPGRAYAPTEAGLELFPRRYAQLAEGSSATAASCSEPKVSSGCLSPSPPKPPPPAGIGSSD